MDATPPKPPGPAAAGRGVKGIFKGKPAWVWVAGVTVLIGVAYLAWSRGSRPATTETTDTPDPTSVDPYYDGTGGQAMYATPGASQGAYGGYDAPLADVGGFAPTDNAGAPELSPNIYIVQPGPTDGSVVTDSIPATVGTNGSGVTGGGHPPRSVKAHLNTQYGNARIGRTYITRTVHGRKVHLYESKPGRGDYGRRTQDRIHLPKKRKPHSAPRSVSHKPQPAHKHKPRR